MKRIFITQSILTLIGILLCGSLVDWGSALSFAIGSLLILADLGILAGTWVWSSKKKLIALFVLVIIFKNVLLGVAIYQLIKQPWIAIPWFLGGVSLIVMTALVMARALLKQDDF